MLPQESLKKEATNLLRNHWDDEGRLRDNEALRAYMIPLIAEVGELVWKHARRMGEHVGHPCAFQVDFFAEVMLWQILEYIAQADHEGETRIGDVSIYQMTERHAKDRYDWPPAPESEVSNGVSR